MQTLPTKLNLGESKPLAVNAYKRRNICTPQNPNDVYIANQTITIAINTGTPGAFIDNDETYLRFDMTIINPNPYIDFVNFGSAGACSLIESISINSNGTDIEVLQDYNTMYELLKDMEGNTFFDFQLFKHTQKTKGLVQQGIRNITINNCKKPMVDRSGRIMNAAYYQQANTNANGAYSTPSELRNVYMPHYQGSKPSPLNFFGGACIQTNTAIAPGAPAGMQGVAAVAATPPPNLFTGNLISDAVTRNYTGNYLGKWSETATGSFLTSQYNRLGMNGTQFHQGPFQNSTPWAPNMPGNVPYNQVNSLGAAAMPLYFGMAGNFVSCDMPIFWDASGNNINGWPFNITNSLIYENDQFDYAENRMQDYFQYLTNVKRIPIGCYSTITPVNVPVVTGLNMNNVGGSGVNSPVPPATLPSTAANGQYLSVPTFSHPAAQPSASLPYGNGVFNCTVCMPILGGLLGVFATKMFPSFLADNLYVKIILTNPYKPYSVTMDPCNIVRGTYRDFSTNIGLHPGLNISNIVFDTLTRHDTNKVRNARSMYTSFYNQAQPGVVDGEGYISNLQFGTNPNLQFATFNQNTLPGAPTFQEIAQSDPDLPFVFPSPFTYYAAGGIHPQYYLPYASLQNNNYGVFNLQNVNQNVYPQPGFSTAGGLYLADTYLPGSGFYFPLGGGQDQVTSELSNFLRLTAQPFANTAYIPATIIAAETPVVPVGGTDAPNIALIELFSNYNPNNAGVGGDGNSAWLPIPSGQCVYLPSCYTPPYIQNTVTSATLGNISQWDIVTKRGNPLPVDQHMTAVTPQTINSNYSTGVLGVNGEFLQVYSVNCTNTYAVPISLVGGSTITSAQAAYPADYLYRNEVATYRGPNGISVAPIYVDSQDGWTNNIPATFNANPNPLYYVNVGNASAACYGTYLDESTDQCLRCFQNGSAPGGFGTSFQYQNQIPQFQVTNVALITTEVLLPDKITAEIIAGSTRGDITIMTKTVKTYSTVLSNNSTTQNIAIPANIGSANSMFIIFRSSQQYCGNPNQLMYNSLKRFCPIGSVTFPNTAATNCFVGSNSRPVENPIYAGRSGDFGFQLKIGADLIPQNPIQTIPEILAEAEKCQHGLWAATNSNLMVSTYTASLPYTTGPAAQTATNLGGQVVVDTPSARSNTFNTYSLIQNKGFTTTFLDFQYMSDQTAFNNPYWAAMDLDFVPLPIGSYQFPMHVPPEGTFLLAFDLDSISGNSENVMGGRYLGNWNTTLQCTGLNYMTTLSAAATGANNNLPTGVQATIFIYCDMRVSFQAGGNIQTFT